MSDEARDLTIPHPTGFRRDGARIWCEKCNRPVQHFEMETPIESCRGPFSGAIQQQYTGEQIVRIECHGESFAWSNWRGIL